MTGEMSRDDVTRDEFPLHFAAAAECGGTVEPFDVYQGPYVYIPGRGRFWLTGGDESGQWYSEKEDTLSYGFFTETGWEDIAANALADLITGGGVQVADVPLAEDAARLAEIGEL